MGACGSKDLPSGGAPRDMSRWQADAGSSPASSTGITGEDPGLNSPDDVRCDLTLNTVVAYPMPGAMTTELCATGWEDGSIKIQNWQTKAVVTKFQPHTRSVNRIVLGPRTGSTYSCSRDTTIAILPAFSTDTKSTSEGPVAPVELSGHTLNVSTITVDNDESSLCSGGRDTKTILWDLTTSTIKAKNTTAQNVITCSKWIPGERVIAQGSEDLSVKLWDERNGLRTPAQTLRGYIYFPLCLDVSEDGHYILTSSKGFNGVGCEARVWDRRTGKQLCSLEGHQQDATACCFLPLPLSAPTRELNDSAEVDVSFGIPPLVTASKDGTVRIWDASTAQLTCEAHEPSARMFTSISHAGNGVILASTLHGWVHAFHFDPHNPSLALLD